LLELGQRKEEGAEELFGAQDAVGQA